MNRSEIKRAQKIVARLNELAAQYKSLQQPASLHFAEVAENLDKLLASPVMANEGDVTNLSTLNGQLKDMLHKYDIQLQEINYEILKNTFYVVLTRLFPKEKESYNKVQESFYSVKPEKLISTVEEWCATHYKEAEEKGLTTGSSPDVVIDNSSEKEVQNG